MATTASPYGLKPVKRADGMPYAGATSQYLIDPAGEGTNLFYGQVVHIGADGYIALSTATGADATTNALPTFISLHSPRIFVEAAGLLRKLTDKLVVTVKPTSPISPKMAIYNA